MVADPVAAPSPDGALHRLGRAPDPLAFPPWQFAGGGRFDDPAGAFRALYAAEQRRAVFVESLARFRPDLATLAGERARLADEPVTPAGAPIPPSWLAARLMGRLRLTPGQRWLDLRAPATREALRGELAPTLLRLGLPDLDVGTVHGPSRELTRAIARWAYERGYRGIRYGSRLDERLANWAIFEGAAFTPDGPPAPVDRDDADLLAVAALFGLTV